MVTLAYCVVVGVMGWGNFDYASPECFVDVVVCNDGYGFIAQRQLHVFADKVLVARVFRMHHDGDVAEHGFGSCGGNY